MPDPLVARAAQPLAGADVVLGDLGHDLVAARVGELAHVVKLAGDADLLAGLVEADSRVQHGPFSHRRPLLGLVIVPLRLY